MFEISKLAKFNERYKLVGDGRVIVSNNEGSHPFKSGHGFDNLA